MIVFVINGQINYATTIHHSHFPTRNFCMMYGLKHKLDYSLDLPVIAVRQRLSTQVGFLKSLCLVLLQKG
jgi:hypothetical protein